MDKIKLFSSPFISIDLKRFLYVLLFIFLSCNVHSQDNTKQKKGVKKIEIVYADIWEVNEKIDKDLQRLLGNVKIKHKESTMLCDSAYYYKNKNQVRAFSKIHIEQGDTLDLYGDYLFYDGNSENALVDGNVELVDKETHLYTKEIEYDIKNQIASYKKNGRITNSDNVLTSKIGVYYISNNLFHFKDSVKIVNPKYVMKADTMDYNTKTETSFFTGPTEVAGDSINLYCEKGWYDTKNDVTSIWKNAFIDNRQQVIHGDSLFFNNMTGYGESFRNVVIQDTTNNLIVTGNYAWYYKQPERFLITDRAMFIQVSNADSLFLHADTISAKTIADTTAKGYRLMKAYHNCRIFSKSFQSKCDSLSYSFQDSVIRLYRAPVIWSQEYQLTSDSMAIFTKNRQTDRMELYTSAFIASRIDTLRFNQIKGRSLTGLFKNNELFKIDIRGNGEILYYLLDGENVAGRDQSKCADIAVLVDKGKISEIVEFQNPEGTTDPPETVKPDPIRLKGFNWYDSLRPKKKADIFKK